MDLTPSVRLSNTQRIALDALRAALVAHGAEDKGVVTVSEDEWRKAAYDAGIASSDTTQQAKRKAFLRARLDLVSSGKVSTNDGRYWIPAPSGTRRYKTLDQSTETGNRAAPEHDFSPTDSHLPPLKAVQSGTRRYMYRNVPPGKTVAKRYKAVHTLIRVYRMYRLPVPRTWTQSKNRKPNSQRQPSRKPRQPTGSASTNRWKEWWNYPAAAG